MVHDDWMWDDAVICAPRGRLDAGTHRELRDHLTKLGADHPRAVVVDLTGLDIAAAGALGVFVSVHMRLAEWPGVPLLLAAGNERSRALLAGSRTARFVPVHDTVGAAVAAVEKPAPRRLGRLTLPNQPTSARIGREFVRRACLRWGIPRLADDAALVANELVSNAVVHTPSWPAIRIELRREVLSIAVYDDMPGDVVLVDPRGTLSDVHGLSLVARLAATRGCSPTRAGGKVVWATLRAGTE